MFGLLRVLVGVFLGLLAFLFVFKFTKTSRRSYFTIIISDILLITVLGFVPLENCVYDFKSAEEVYEYYYYAEQKAELVVEGTQSALVVGRKNDTTTLLIVPKTIHGWKIGVSSNTQKALKIFFDGIVVIIYKHNNIDDYYISVFSVNGDELTVSDDYNTKFHSMKDDTRFLNKVSVTYYGHILNYNSQYSITVNDKKIVLATNQSGDGTR